MRGGSTGARDVSVPLSADFSPWNSDAMVRVIALNMLAGVLLGVVWFQTSGEATARNQLSWFELGLAAIGLCGAANANWLLKGHRAISASCRELEANRIRDALIFDDQLVAGDDQVVAGPAMSRYHRPGCAFAAGRQISHYAPAAAVASGWTPCEACRPVTGDDSGR